MPHSHHSHSGQFCRHAKSSLEEVVLEAIRQSFEVFGLSEHAPRYRLEDLYPEEADLSTSDLLDIYESFLTEAIRLRTLYSDQISLLIGLETDCITELDLIGTTDLLFAHPEVDYIVGSVHHVNGIPIDFDRPTWLRCVRDVVRHEVGTTMISSPSGPVRNPSDQEDPSPQASYTPSLSELRPFLLAFFDAQYRLLQTHQPEVVGHFDLCLLWTPDIPLGSDQLEGILENVERNVEYVVGYGGLFEANSAAFRKGWGTSYPSREVFQIILKHQGRICLSDDSHGVHQVGLNYIEMRDYLEVMGFREIYYLVSCADSRDGDESVGKRGRVVVRRLAVNWRDHPFWQELIAAQNTEH